MKTITIADRTHNITHKIENNNNNKKELTNANKPLY